ncbi:WXG100 family type VII secretion target [Paenibacillus pabuli]|uniref:WXG100 family type VII secretion target n=2 Tax=Paenibacillus TaxID=44249 RepID=A0A855Y5Z5_9BACL|nr:WXG100 family type VII secretion target [Paenibacillus pabuli]PXW11228.1 WXG100 family type VII secretion target [Paenibacillus taichungensis]
MQRIQVHPDVLEEKARLVQQKKLELERMVRELEKSIYLLQSEWSGVTGERFFWDFMQVKEVFPATLGLLDKIQNEFIFIAKNFRTADGSGEVALYIPEELKRNFGVGLLDKSVGETVTGIGQTAEALFYDPFGTVTSVAYAMTLGRVVDVGRGIKFAWDAAWGNGTARSDVGQFVDEQKKQVNESGAGYYSGSVMGQVLAYAFVGKALRTVENKHSDLGGSGGGKPERGEKGSDNKEIAFITDPTEMKRYITPPKDGFQAFLERNYIEIRTKGIEDVPIVAKNTGLTEEQVTNMKRHLFLTTYNLSIEGKPYKENYFQADGDIAYAWKKAQNGALNEAEKDWFRTLANHELREKELMGEGMPLRDRTTWNAELETFKIDVEKNAHDKAAVTAPNPPPFPGYDPSKDFGKYYDNEIDY